MSIQAGTPRLGQKIAVALGLGHAIGLTDAEIALVKAGENRDLSKAEATVFDLVGPLLNQDAATLEQDLAGWVVSFLTTVQTFTNLPQLAAEVKAAITTDAPQLLHIVETMGEALWQALVGLALNKVGKTLPPA